MAPLRAKDVLSAYTVTIPRVTIAQDHSGDFGSYGLSVKSPGAMAWSCFRRYRQFAELRSLLPAEGGGGAEFPPKAMLNRTAPERMEERRLALQAWVQAVCGEADSWPLEARSAVRSFVGAMEETGEEPDAARWAYYTSAGTPGRAAAQASSCAIL